MNKQTPTTRNAQPDALQEAVAKALRVLFHACLKFSQQFDPDNPAQVGVYVWACRDARVSPEAVNMAAQSGVRRLTEWPTAGQFAELCRSCMDTIEARRFSRYVSCVDENGNSCMAPPECVRHGVLLPEGDTSGDGSPAPPALPSSKRFCREEFWRERLAAAERDGKPDRVRFAKAMVDMLLSGSDAAEQHRAGGDDGKPQLAKIGKTR